MRQFVGALAMFTSVLGASPAAAQIALGQRPPVVKGLRFVVRDRGPEARTTGVQVSVWSPVDGAAGTAVRGVVVGAPLAFGGRVHGLAVGPMGAGALHDARGIIVGGLGTGAGGSLRGLTMALGGVGVGHDLRGIIAGGLGVGAGGDLTGVVASGVGVGAGGSGRGVLFGGAGVGVGGDLTGLVIGGVGVGAGGRIHGLALSAGGIGAAALSGMAVAPFVGARRAQAFVVAPLAHLQPRGGAFRGVAVAPINALSGTQRGLVIGLVNYTRTLHGVQVGLINVAGNARLKVSPVLNVAR